MDHRKIEMKIEISMSFIDQLLRKRTLKLDIKILENKKNIILEKILKLMLIRFIINFGTINLLSFLKIFCKKHYGKI